MRVNGKLGVATPERTHRALVPLALEDHLEADKGIDLEDSDTVNSTVTGTPCHSDLPEARFSEQSLAQTLETFGVYGVCKVFLNSVNTLYPSCVCPLGRIGFERNVQLVNHIGEPQHNSLLIS